MNQERRQQAITRTSLIGIAVNAALVAFKMAVGLIAGSISVILDAVNNLSDALSSVITIAGIRLAKRPADRDHPFGHGRVEYFSTILIALLILFAGGSSLVESVKQIFKPEPADYSAASIIVIVASIGVKLLLGRFVKGQGEKYNSDALIASGSDAGFDAILSAATLAGAVVTMIFGISIDGFIGAGISLVILKAGIGMLMDAIHDVIGARPDSAVTADIKKAVREIPGVLGAYDLVLHNYGPESAIGTIHVEVPADMSAYRFNQLTKQIQRTVFERFHVFLTVGIYAIDTKDPVSSEITAYLHTLFDGQPGIINIHGIFIDREARELWFDMTLDFSIRDKAAFLEKAADSIRQRYPDLKVHISPDTNYCD